MDRRRNGKGVGGVGVGVGVGVALGRRGVGGSVGEGGRQEG